VTGAVSPPNIWHCSCSPTFREGTANVQDRSDSEVTVPCERLRGAGHSPDHLRLDRDVVAFVCAFCASGKLVAAVCHGPQLLIEADAVSGRTLTSWPSVRKDLRNAGARWIDREVVEDGNLITSRKPEDLEAFSDAILRRLHAPMEVARGM